MSKFKEVEFKYYAREIPKELFDKTILSLGIPNKSLLLFANAENGKDSVDHYFSTPDQRFMRWREGQTVNGTKTWELTSKNKLNKNNNNIRDEVNLPLVTGSMSKSKAEAFSNMHGCLYDFSIKKDVQIYWFDKVVFSRYTTFDLDDKELDVFMEIEADEEYPWESEQEAFDEVCHWERKLSVLGITPQHRIKKSLFEFYSGQIKKDFK